VLFCDLTGSTALGETLDAERLRGLLGRYFERMKAIVERHGGTVEKFIGDAVMAVFGVPLLREDDALRAVRAALEMRDAVPELGLQVRIGLMTGEVVTGTEERLATGDAVNVAARLEAAAAPGEVLIGEPTYALVRDTVDVEPVEPLALKGKAQPVPAYRLLGIHDAPERPHLARFVGRERELELVQAAWHRVQAEKRCELLTIVGDAGVGKSRLVAEALAGVSGTVVRGRCLPYGDGITYWPVVEVLKQLAVSPPDAAAAAVIRSLLGDRGVATSSEEIAWAVRKTFEHAAAMTPLAVVFDDIQWGEQTFRDLIEHVALLSSGAAILLVCMARPDLAERQPGWPVTLRLEPLGDEEVAALMAERVPRPLRERIAHAAGGNPLFVEEMLAMAAQADGEVLVPPTLRALLAARLDELGTDERSVLERGAVEGEIFHRGAVQALGADDALVTPRLAALVRKQLVRPDQTQLPGEDGFRFRHLLIRDAAYDGLPKAVRADLHARFAAWLELHGTGLVELDELVGYHLEQAVRYRVQLGLPDDPGLAAAARTHLTSAGRRAKLRQDDAAGLSLLERAAWLAPPSEIELSLDLDLIDAMVDAGKSREALSRAGALVARAAAAGDQVGALCARIKEATLRSLLEPEGVTERLAALVEEALPVFGAAGDELALYTAYLALGQVENMRAHIDASLAAYERAAAHAQLAGLPEDLLRWRAITRFAGTTPVPEILAWFDEQEARGALTPTLRGYRANALAMLGRFEEALAILAEARAELADRGGGIWLATLTAMTTVDVELLAGDAEAAVAFGEEGCRQLDQLGELSYLSTAAAGVGQALVALDRLDEADLWAGRAAEAGASDDVFTQMLWRQVRAKVLGRRGELEASEQLAREAVALGEQTEMLDARGGAYVDLADVLALAGRPHEAIQALGQALECYRRKGNLVATQRAEARRAELQSATSP
jgi:class 3 adenylate cyclase/tetratricopeptide (TPR) repeat protein